MRVRTVSVVTFAALAIAGCTIEPKETYSPLRAPYDPPKSIDKMTDAEKCSYYQYYLTNPSITDYSKNYTLTKIKEMNCPPPAR